MSGLFEKRPKQMTCLNEMDWLKLMDEGVGEGSLLFGRTC